MKKHLIACTAAALAGSALAQDSVSLFGTLDVNLTHARQAGASHSFVGRGGYQSSVLGLRGLEDLGNGRSAGFWLEGDINPARGGFGGTTTEAPKSPGAAFNRRATISLSGGWGELRLGRDYVPSFWNDAIFDPFGTQGIGSAHTTAIRGTNWGTGGADGLYVRSSNSVSWLWGFKPHVDPYAGTGGLYVHLMYAFPEKGNNSPNKSNRYTGGRVGYKGGAFNVAATYGESAGTATASPTNALNVATGPYSTYKTWSLGGKYSFDFGSLYAQYGVNKTDVPGTKWSHSLLGATYLTSNGYFRSSFSRTRNDDLGEIGMDQWAVGYVHFLSKRTSLYATYAHVQPKGYANNANALESTYPFNVGDEDALGNPRGRSGSAYSVGIAHSF